MKVHLLRYRRQNNITAALGAFVVVAEGPVIGVAAAAVAIAVVAAVAAVVAALAEPHVEAAVAAV